ncbi:SDR family oxidoreductase [Radicibacter daui]|uniref:SDR family oxidoreductase n=1 Tax=Radicibacter daui TaxID=3064829 RepID=UPI004046FF15
MSSLAGKTVVIVGGSSGVGLGVAAAALSKGARTYIIGRSAEKLKVAEQSLGGQGSVIPLSADMTREDEVVRLFAQIGSFDHLVATAGTPPTNYPIGETDVAAVKAFVENKLMGAVILAKHAAGALVPDGSMTFTSGINKDRPPVPGGSVVAAIAGSFGYFARALALELAPARVNVVSPGWVDTPMWDELVGDAKAGFFAQMAPRLPAGRIATPRDVAAAYLFLMESDFTTGETIRIDGGQNLI